MFALMAFVFVNTWEPRHELGPRCAGGGAVLAKGSDCLYLISEILLSNCLSVIAKCLFSCPSSTCFIFQKAIKSYLGLIDPFYCKSQNINLVLEPHLLDSCYYILV